MIRLQLLRNRRRFFILFAFVLSVFFISSAFAPPAPYVELSMERHKTAETSVSFLAGCYEDFEGLQPGIKTFYRTSCNENNFEFKADYSGVTSRKFDADGNDHYVQIDDKGTLTLKVPDGKRKANFIGFTWRRFTSGTVVRFYDGAIMRFELNGQVIDSKMNVMQMQEQNLNRGGYVNVKFFHCHVDRIDYICPNCANYVDNMIVAVFNDTISNAPLHPDVVPIRGTDLDPQPHIMPRAPLRAAPTPIKLIFDSDGPVIQSSSSNDKALHKSAYHYIET